MLLNKKHFYLCNFRSQVDRLAYSLQDAKIKTTKFFCDYKCRELNLKSERAVTTVNASIDKQS